MNGDPRRPADPTSRLSPERRACTLRRQVLAFGLFLVVALGAVHALDRRALNWDVTGVLSRSVALAQDGRLIYAGQSAYHGLTLGPLAHVLGALPLLVSRDGRADYWFCSLLLALGAAIYYVACRRLAPEGCFAPLAAAIFAAVMLHRSVPIMPMDWMFSPPFLALFFLLLVRPGGREPWNQALLWITIGLCMQLQLTNAILAPAALAARPPRTRRDWLGAAVGAAVLLALHAHLAWQLHGMITGADRPGWEQVRPGELGRWKEIVLGYAAAPVLLFGVGTAFAALLSLLDWHEPAFRARFRPLVRALAVQYGCALILFPIFNAFKPRVHIYYYLPALTLWAALAARFVDSSLAAGSRRLRRAGGAAAWVGLVVTLAAAVVASLDVGIMGTPDFCAATQLNDQIALAKRVDQIIVRDDLRDIRIVSAYHQLEANHGPPAYRRVEFTTSWEPLCRRIAPELAERFAVDPARQRATVHLMARPAPPTPPRAADDCEGARLLDRFRVGGLYVAVCLAPATASHLPPPRFAAAPAAGNAVP